MKQLEVKTYTRQEIADITNIDAKDKNFARKTKDTLTKWGYSFEYSRKNINITRIPETATEKLSELMIRYYDLDIQIDAYDFAIFTYCLLADLDGFSSMPWEARSNYLNEEWNVLISDRTLRTWCSKLIKTNTISKDTGKKTYWTSFTVNGVKYQEELENGRLNPQWKKYWELFFKLKEAGETNLGGKCYEQLGYCVYSCPSFVFNAWDDNDLEVLAQLYSLIIEIADDEPFDTVVETTTRIIDVPREKEVVKYENEIDEMFNLTQPKVVRVIQKSDVNLSAADGSFKF